jgi:hypothetical protein
MRGQNSLWSQTLGGGVARWPMNLWETSHVNFLLRVNACINAFLADTAFALTLYILHKYGEMFLQF